MYFLSYSPVILTVPHETRRNGTLFLHIFLVPPFIKQDRTFVDLQKVKFAICNIVIYVYVNTCLLDSPTFYLFYTTLIISLQDIFTSYTAIKMTQYIVPEAEAFKLLGDRTVEKANSQIVIRPVSHMKSRVTFTIMTDNVMLPIYGIPAELVNHIKYINFYSICATQHTYISNNC